MVIDPSVSLGNLLTILTMLFSFVGIWLRSEKLLATLSIRVAEVERRATEHDGENRRHEDWHTNHLIYHKSA